MARSAVTSRHADSGEAAVLGKAARVRGRIHGTGDLCVEGVVEGDVQISGELSISQGGSVQGEVEALQVVVSGELVGDVSAQGAVTIGAGARLIGSVSGAEIELDEAAVFAGRIDMDFDLPSELTAR